MGYIRTATLCGELSDTPRPGAIPTRHHPSDSSLHRQLRGGDPNRHRSGCGWVWALRHTTPSGCSVLSPPHPPGHARPTGSGVCVCVGGGRGAPRHATPQWELAGTQHPGMALRVATARWELTNRELSEPPNPGLSSSHHHHTHGESSPTCPTPGESFPNRQAHIASFQKRHIPVGSSPCRRTPGANSPTRQINHHHIVADVRVVIVCVVAADVVVVVVVVGV